jgi:hypothetical protein
MIENIQELQEVKARFLAEYLPVVHARGYNLSVGISSHPLIPEESNFSQESRPVCLAVRIQPLSHSLDVSVEKIFGEIGTLIPRTYEGLIVDVNYTGKICKENSISQKYLKGGKIK